MSSPLRIYIAYSAEDKEYLDKLHIYLKPLENNNKANIWYKDKVEPGIDTEPAIIENLHSADIILLLVSADALASEDSYREEMNEAIAFHAAGTAKVIALMLRYCMWESVLPRNLQILPENGEVLKSWKDQDEVYKNVVDSLMALINEMAGNQEIETEPLRQEYAQIYESTPTFISKQKTPYFRVWLRSTKVWVIVLVLLLIGFIIGNYLWKKKLHKALVEEFANEMVFIKGGTFEMGSTQGQENEKPVHLVTVSDFYMSKNEVTFSQFRQFMEANPEFLTDADKDGGSQIWNGRDWERKAGVNWRCNAEGRLYTTEEYDYPVIHVSWNDAVAFCEWLKKETGKTYRLPTEAEWEYAAGNGVKHTRYSWGSAFPSGKKGGNVADMTAKQIFFSWVINDLYDDGYVFTAPVGQFDPNEFGLYDMTGNVWEWCSDWYSDYPPNTQNNPKGPKNGSEHSLRSGTWGSLMRDCGVSIRNSSPPTYRDGYIGFRVAW